MRQTDRKEKGSCKTKLRDISSNLRKPKRELDSLNSKSNKMEISNKCIYNKRDL